MRQRGASPGPTPPTPTPQFEVWADLDCTIKPVIGQTYQKLYLKFNVDFNQSSPTYEYGTSGQDFTQLRVNYDVIDTPPITIRLYVDGFWEQGDPIDAGDIITIDFGPGITPTEPLVTEFGTI